MEPSSEDHGGVSVMLRIRPRNAKEQEGEDCWSWSDDAIVEEGPSGNKRYAYDRCFAPGVGNREVYEVCGRPVVGDALRGVNGTIFTYGQTGSGKTHSILGVPSDPGILQRTVADIFEAVDVAPERSWKVRVAYMEVYNEEINDLLNVGRSDEDQRRGKNLKIVSDDPVRGAVIAGLTETEVGDAAALLNVIKSGEAQRAYGSTEMNDKSSRSHTICKLSIESEETRDDDDALDDLDDVHQGGGAGKRTVAKRSACLSLVDLAGSERQKSTGASGARLKEGSNINRSLLTLGRVINKLTEQANRDQRERRREHRRSLAAAAQGGVAVHEGASQQAKAADAGAAASGPGRAHRASVAGSRPRSGSHATEELIVPYRESKLTRILKQSLGGNRGGNGAIRRRFNVGVLEAPPERHALWVRPERWSLVQK